MARYGSEAVARTTQFEHEYAPEQSTRTSFEVVPGGGLDADDVDFLGGAIIAGR